MARKSKKISRQERLAQVEKKLQLLDENEFILKFEWLKSPDSEASLKRPEKARISNWDTKSDFYNSYNNGDDSAKLQLFRMMQRLFSVNKQEGNIFKKTFSKKSYLFYLWISTVSLLTMMFFIIAYLFTGNRVQETNNTTIYLVIALGLLFFVLISLYFLFKVNKIMAYKNKWIKEYFGNFWSQKNVKFSFSKEAQILKFLDNKIENLPAEIPDFFTDQDFLNFKVLFFREFYFHEPINPRWKYKVKYKLFSLNFSIVHFVFFLGLITSVAMLVLTLI
ncbi:hypothetical protein EI74_0388 [Mycoplasma testudineum]|uniref:Uncharacterized protein n=1 Tax=Mycoplasma testudineum TaxID=244584 RepID=A0A4R6IET6_9MOLU|nr:hypothetical protein [Mycoplasma testudineum]OYD27004.1 hypothetical protein CG473_01565 [Mycoplasma testudineum]TDO20552.1 hypothetical protein EI74_0388 [Mycoplasma testudineum]